MLRFKLIDREQLPKAQQQLAFLSLIGVLLSLSGCGFGKAEAEAQTDRGQPQTPAADVAIARTASLRQDLEFTGTTAPVREVSLRSQIEGRILSLDVNAGDVVSQGAIVGEIDGSLLVSAVQQAQADLAAQRAEVAQAQAEVSDAQTELLRAQAELEQAQRDAARLEGLADQGAITQQAAEQARTEARTAEQALRSAQAQIATRQQAVGAAQERVAAQAAIVSQAQERQSYTQLISPVTGVVLERVTEPGNLAQAGSEIVRIGDFSQVKIQVDVSELTLANLRVGQPVQVRLDAFGDRQWQGRISRISPAADPTARLVPVEVTLANPDDRIGSGLLARVTFGSSQANLPIVVPQTAVQTEPEQEDAGTLFVVNQTGEQATVEPRSVRLGKRADGQVEVLSGLRSGERFVARSSQPLKAGEAIRLSILSESESGSGSPTGSSSPTESSSPTGSSSPARSPASP